MSETCYLILDQGGQSSRALVISVAGQTLARASLAVATQTPAVEKVEQDAEELVSSLQQVAEEAVAKLTPEQRRGLFSAGLVTQRSSMVCWKCDTLEAITPVISWQDRRAHAWLERQKINPQWFRRHTGLYPSAHYGASKMHWCLNNDVDVQQTFIDGNLMFGPLAGYLAARLTGSLQVKVDPANAQRTGLYNIDSNNWDADLLQLFDIPRSLLPELTFTCDNFGSLTLPDFKLPLQLLSGDQSTAIYAYGEPTAGTAYINVGTGAFVSALWHEKNYPEQLLKSVVYSGEQSQFVVEGTVNGAGSALNWAQDLLHLEDTEELDELEISTDEVPLFINAVGGLGSPYWQASLMPSFVGQGSDRQKLLAVQESIKFLLQSNLVVMQAHGFHLQKIIISGGLSQSDIFCRNLADLTNIPVWRPEEVEASARGAAYLLAQQSRGGCVISVAEWSKLAGTEFTPDNGVHEQLNHRFGRWREALQTHLSELSD